MDKAIVIQVVVAILGLGVGYFNEKFRAIIKAVFRRPTEASTLKEDAAGHIVIVNASDSPNFRVVIRGKHGAVMNQEEDVFPSQRPDDAATDEGDEK
ncbi:hypothetical protein [Terrabacter terrigena]|uniref:Uncharacterized protein n=1 Tax=Terrabacter terrigena TaxID=574718 RepID=A0ABW3MZ32_9MICO